MICAVCNHVYTMNEDSKRKLTQFIGRDNETGLALPLSGTEFNERPITPNLHEKITPGEPTLEIPGAYIREAVLEPDTDDQTKEIHDLSDIEGDESLALDTVSSEDPALAQRDAMLGIKPIEERLAAIKGDEPIDMFEAADLPAENYLPDTAKHTTIKELSASQPSKPELTPNTAEYKRITKELAASGYEYLGPVDHIQVTVAKTQFLHSLSNLIKNRSYEFAEVPHGDNVEIWIRIFDEKTPE